MSALTVVVSTQLEGLVAAHNDTHLLVLLVLEEANVTGTPLPPLLALSIKAKQPSTPDKSKILRQFVFNSHLDATWRTLPSIGLTP